MNNLTKNDLVDQLHLAMKLNQVDLARDRINAAQRTISTADAHDLMIEGNILIFLVFYLKIQV